MQQPLHKKPTIIIGLGNPEREYDNTYHNIGSIAVTLLQKQAVFLGIAPSRIFTAPTWMNESGLFVKKTLAHFRASPDDMLILHDDSDLELGKFLVSYCKGAGGHKGVADIIATLGTNCFPRLRIGIRPLGDTRKALSFVLNRISLPHRLLIEKAITVAGNDIIARWK